MSDAGRRQLAASLLGAEVVDRAEGRPGQRQGRLGDGSGDPEVGHLHPAFASHQDVAGLDVAMDETIRVGRGDRPRHLGRQPRRLAWGQGSAAPDDRGQVLAVDQLHDDEGANRIGAVVVDTRRRLDG